MNLHIVRDHVVGDAERLLDQRMRERFMSVERAAN